MDLAAELEASLKEFMAAGLVDLHENGGRTSFAGGLSWEVRGDRGKPLLHLWAERFNVTRRVLAITDHSEQRLVLAVERFGRSKPDRLEFVRREFERGARQLSREEFCEQLRAVLAEQFPDDTVESLAISADLEHSLSGNYARGLLRRGSLRYAALAVPSGESSDTIDNCLTFALLWLSRVRHSHAGGTIAGLRVILPKNTSRTVARCFGALDPRLVIDLYEHDPMLNVLERIDPKSAGNVDTWLVPVREPESLLQRARQDLDWIIAAEPNSTSLHPVVQTREVWLRFRGLPFARWDDGRVYFGFGECRRELTPTSQTVLKQLLGDLARCRHPLASDTRHALYRAQPERWLESLVRDDVTRVDAGLDARFVYSQVFASTAGERGILDLLTVTRSGRLAIIELKAGEHIHLPLQAADYWLRVKKHLERGELSRYGYFPGVELQQMSPLVYLVAPALRFHPSTDELLKFLSPDLEVVRLGLAENWRWGLRVVMRQLVAAFLLRIPNRPRAGWTEEVFTFFVAVSQYNLGPRRGPALQSGTFTISIRKKGAVSLLDVAGRLTSFEIDALHEAVSQLLKEGRKNIVLNLGALGYLDSSGIGELARSYVAVVKKGGAMKVVGLSAKVEEVLKITQLFRVFPEFPSEEEGVDSFPESRV